LARYVNKSNLTAGLVVAFFTFFVALLVGLGSEVLIKTVDNNFVSIILLLLIIFLGIFFDIIGTAATAASMPPFNARAAKKVSGAQQAVKIVQNADRVANFCNDVIGDIAGTLSGAIGAAIVINLADELGVSDLVLSSAVMTGLIASLTVGGKAIGKNVAVKNANCIIFRTAVVMNWWEKITGIEFPKSRKGS
jgi:CBS domain containing-hemolysin-like protein